jgi:hypothetical protein
VSEGTKLYPFRLAVASRWSLAERVTYIVSDPI